MDQENSNQPIYNDASVVGQNDQNQQNSYTNSQNIPPEDEWKNPAKTGPISSPNIGSNSTSQQEPASPPPPPPEEGFFSNFSLGKILKVALGLFFIIFLFFLIFKIILPHLGKKTPQNVTLAYWGLWEDSHVMNSVISDFERQNPNIKITYEKEDIKDYRERLSTRIENGNGPDIFRFHNSWYPMIAGDLLPLPSSVISKEDFSKNYYMVAGEDLIKNGAIYGIPLEIDTLALFVNNDLLNAAGISSPKTWEDFRDFSKQLTVKDEQNKIKTSGAAMGTYANISHAPDIVSLLMLQNGAKITDIGSTIKQATDAIRFYTSFASSDGNVWDDTLDPSLLSFAKGNTAMIFGYSWDYFTVKSINPQLNFKVEPVPQLTGGTKINLASYWAEGVSSKSKHQKEALIFMKYLTDPKVQEKLFSEESKVRTFGEPYSNQTLAPLLKSDSNLSIFTEEAKTAVSSFMVDGTYDNGLNTKSDKYLEDAINSVNQNASPDSATDTLGKGISQILSQYGL